MNSSFSGNRGIPVVHIYWDQGFHSAPDLVQRIATLWRKALPCHCVNSYSSVEADVILRDYGLDPNGLEVPLKADVFRLHLLEKYGGLWVDATLLPTSNTQSWLQQISNARLFMFRDPGPDRIISSWLIYSEPDHPLVKEWRKSLVNLLSSSKPVVEAGKFKKAVIYALVRIKPSLIPRPFIQQLLQVYPYFITHYTFDWLVRSCPTFFRELRKMPYIHADGPHQLQREIRRNPGLGSSSLRSLLVSAPVHKLTWKEGELYGRILSVVEREFAASKMERM